MRALVQLDEWVAGDIGNHSRGKLKERLGKIGQLCSEIDPENCYASRLGKLAEVAYDVWERDLARELRLEQAKLQPKLVAPQTAIAWTYYAEGRAKDAEFYVKTAISLDPTDAYAHQILSRIYLDAGDLDKAQEEAIVATKSASYAWPHQVLARIALARGNFSVAVDAAKKGVSLDGETSALRTTHSEMLRAKAAAAAIELGQEVERNRLRLIRSYCGQGLKANALAEIAKLPKTSKLWPDAQLAFAETTHPLWSDAQREQAYANIGVLTEEQQRARNVVRARAALHALPQDAGLQLQLAKSLVGVGEYHQALALLGNVQNGTPQADCYEMARKGLQAARDLEIADAAWRRSDLPTAQAMSLKLMDIFRQTGERNSLIRATYMYGSSMSMDGRFTEALAVVKPVLEQMRREGEFDGTIDLSWLEAGLESNFGSLRALTQAYEITREQCAARDREGCLASVWRELASTHLSEGRIAQSKSAAQTSIEFADQCADARAARSARSILADAHLTLSELPQCQHIADQLLRKSRKHSDNDREHFALMLLGAVAMERGDVAKAIAHFEAAYECGRRAGFTSMRAVARLFVGYATMNAAHDDKSAATAFAKAEQLYGQLNDQDGRARALRGLGEAQQRLGNHPAALAALDEGLAIVRKLVRNPMIASFQSERALLYAKLHDADRAVAAATEAVTLADRTDEPGLRASAHFALAAALEAAKKDEAAVKEYEIGVLLRIDELAHTGGEQERSGALAVGRTRDQFRQVITLHLRLGNINRALELLELARDTELRRLFDPSKVKAQDPKLSKALDDLKEAEAQAAASKKALSDELAKPKDQRNDAKVEALNQVVARSDGELRQLMLKLKRDHGAIYDRLTVKPESISDLRDSLPPDTIVVEYFQAEDALYAFVIARDKQKPRAFRSAVTAAELEQTVFEFRRAIEREDGAARGAKVAVPGKAKEKRGSEAFGADAPLASNTLELAAKLHKWLIAPLEGEMSAAKTTLILPFGPLHYLPFQALATLDADGKPTYVLEKHRIGYLSTATILKLLYRQKSEATRTLLAFANPDGTLPGARAEMERVKAKSFPEANVLYEGAATKGKFFELASHYSIVHFATHGVLSADAAASHLKMAKETLTVNEIMGFEGMEGHTDLVVLSACETAIALGNSTGAELTTLASAFSAAGAPTLIASLWAVDDTATSELMATFYDSLRNKPGQDTLEALRQAQLHVMRLQIDGKRPFEAPTYWAAFSLIGDYR